MKKIIFILFSIIMFSCASEKKKIETVVPHKIILKNNSGLERIAEPIVISQEKLNTVLGDSIAQPISFEDVNGVKIPFQKDNFSGKVEYALSIDFKANETKEILVKVSDSITTFTAYTNIRLGKDANNDGIYDDIKSELRDSLHLPGAKPVLYQAEGISWENDKVGFRTYWDKRNGKDIWGKTTDKMVLDSIGLPNTPSYHDIQPWGVDILKVGNSLGAGALAMVKDGKLYRLGETKQTSFKILTEGPVRAVMVIDYKGWDVDGENFDLSQKITIWKGQYGYISDVTLKGSKQKLVTGIVNIHLEKDSLETKKINDTKTIMYTFGNQTEVHDNLGMGLILNDKSLVEIKKAPSTGTGKSIDGNSPITHTYYAELENENNQFSFYFLAGWEKTSTEFKTKEGFEKMLINESNKLNNPIIIE